MKKSISMLLSLSISISALYGSCSDLLRAYPHYIKSCKNNRVVWYDGTKMVYDDGKKKSFYELLNRADIEDMFHYPYPKGKASYNKAPAKNYDPGRIRNEPFFLKMYGNSPSVVRRHLKSIRWLPKTSHRAIYLRVTDINGVDKALSRVSKRLDSLVMKNPSLKKYLIPTGGTFKWRKIAGTNRLSVHSFGAAIDINVKYSAYWRWNKGKYRYRNSIPYAIVKAFEDNGFIWGGKWYHYDTMHFEYRPELLHMKSASRSRL